MSEAINCSCGAVLVDGVTESGVQPVGSDTSIVFRRTTDYVMCASCLATYDVGSLIARAKDRETIERLENIAREIGAADV